MSTTRLPKIALEEAYEHPDNVARILASEQELARVSDGGGVTPEYYRPVQEKLGEFEDVRLGSMDAAGIEHTIISLTAPGIQAITDPSTATATARKQNDFLAGQVARHPGRYSGFAAVALQEPGHAVRELRRAVTELGFKGLLVNGYTNVGDPGHGRYLDDPAYYPLWEALSELDVPLYLHPRPALPGGLALYDGHPEMKGATWGFGTETAAHTVRLLLGGHFDRFPAARLILGHMGEALPALLWRTQNMFELNPFGQKISKTLPEYFADNIWITTSGNFSDNALINAILTVGADHILFSVDYPYSQNAAAAAWIEKTPISELDRRKIAYGNARALFSLGSSTFALPGVLQHAFRQPTTWPKTAGCHRRHGIQNLLWRCLMADKYPLERLDRFRAALVLVDHQAGLLLGVHDHDQEELRRNVIALTKIAKAYHLPVVITTSADDGPNGALLPEVAAELPDAVVVRRPGEIDAFDNGEFAAAVKAAGREQLIVAGISTDVCVTFAALSAAAHGYRVHAVLDASGTWNALASQAAQTRMLSAGVVLNSTVAIAAELQSDWRNEGAQQLAELMAGYAIPFYGSLISYATSSREPATAS